MPGEGDGRGGEGGSASGASAGLVAEGGEGASGAVVAAGMGPGTSVACAAGCQAPFCSEISVPVKTVI